MKLRANRTTIYFLGTALFLILGLQLLFSTGILNSFWYTIIRQGAVIAMVALGLNLIYGFNGQFSLGQWGFYAIGAYTAADVMYRWTQNKSADGLVVLILVDIFVGLVVWGIARIMKLIRGLDTLSAFAIYLLGVVLATILAVSTAQVLIAPITRLLLALPTALVLQVVFFLAVIMAGILAAEISYLFGLPILTLGSDYFGIATLGFTIIMKVLADNSDRLLGFEEMKGARGMIGIPKLASWLWIAFFLLITIIIIRNLLHSSHGRAIISVREDELAAKTMGINVANQKIVAFVLGSLFAGLAGGLYAHINGFLHPSKFDFIQSFDPLIIIVFGGLGSVSGTVVASFAWALVLEGILRLVLPPGFETWRYVVYPLLLILMMLLRPKGLLGGFEFPFIKTLLPPIKKKDTPVIPSGGESS